MVYSPKYDNSYKVKKSKNGYDSECTFEKCFKLLQRNNGKLEVTYKEGKSEHINNYKVCLIFVRFPISPHMLNRIKRNIKGLEDNPMSKGKMHIETTGPVSNLVGAIRVKYILNMPSVLYSFMNKMIRFNYSAKSNSNSDSTDSNRRV